MIETIWPLSTVSCGRDSGSGNKQQNLIGLRTFVQEVLRRSKTSYSTLQVALYYLILIQSCLPKHDFTMEQAEDSASCRAMQCGRRMFLSALILASKYLQDRNYSARAWSKISGLRTCEININEMAFLSAVNWKLHIPESVFHRWTDIVLKYSPSAQVCTLMRSSHTQVQTWKSIVPHLTPDLDSSEFGGSAMSNGSGYKSAYNSPGSDMSPPPIPMHADLSACSGSNESTPTDSYTIPRVLEPTPRDTKSNDQTLPPLAHLGLLPTPQLTPQTGTFCTPAASASGYCPRRSSMSYAMGQIRESFLARSILDKPCDWKPRLPEPFPTSARRSSLARSVSLASSPESMISDVSSRPSRSSSISSVASSTCALQQPRLAVQATRRCANMQLCGLKEEIQPSTFHSSPERGISWEQEFEAFHEADTSKSYPARISKGHGNVQIQRSASTREAAVALQDLALNRQLSTPTPSTTSRPSKGVKRSRPNSMDLSVQATVRDLIAPRCLGDITNMRSRNQNDGTVLADEKVADSFLLPNAENVRPLNVIDLSKKAKPSMSREGLSRKRTCAGSDRGGREEARMIERIVKGGENRRPAVWEGVIGFDQMLASCDGPRGSETSL